MLGPPPDADDTRWLAEWWPVAEGARAEVGRPRDAAWAGVIAELDRGVAVAVDYAHDRAARPRAGSLAAYRDGRQVDPVPDGSCDITAHVALDACAAAGRAAGATLTVLTDQRSALRALGVDAGRPDRALAAADPRGYAAALGRAGATRELIEKSGLGSFGWLVQTVSVTLPARLRSLGDSPFRQEGRPSEANP